VLRFIVWGVYDTYAPLPVTRKLSRRCLCARFRAPWRQAPVSPPPEMTRHDDANGLAASRGDELPLGGDRAPRAPAPGAPARELQLTGSPPSIKRGRTDHRAADEGSGRSTSSPCARDASQETSWRRPGQNMLTHAACCSHRLRQVTSRALWPELVRTLASKWKRL
jgi:hypothetical protein